MYNYKVNRFSQKQRFIEKYWNQIEKNQQKLKEINGMDYIYSWVQKIEPLRTKNYQLYIVVVLL